MSIADRVRIDNVQLLSENWGRLRKTTFAYRRNDGEWQTQTRETYDRGKKFENYRTLDSLTEYVMIAQDRVHVEHYVRQQDNQWLLSEAKELQDAIELPTIQCTLALADVYDKVDFQARAKVLRENSDD